MKEGDWAKIGPGEHGGCRDVLIPRPVPAADRRQHRAVTVETSRLRTNKNRRSKQLEPAVWKNDMTRLLGVGLRFAETDDFVAGFELAAFFEQLHALKALQNVAFCRDGAGSF